MSHVVGNHETLSGYWNFRRSELRFLLRVFFFFSSSYRLYIIRAMKITRSTVAVFSSRTSSYMIHFNACQKRWTPATCWCRNSLWRTYVSQDSISRVRFPRSGNAFHFVPPIVFSSGAFRITSNSRSHRGEAPRPRPIIVEKSCQLGDVTRSCSNDCVYREAHYATISGAQRAFREKGRFNRTLVKPSTRSDSYVRDGVIPSTTSCEKLRSLEHVEIKSADPKYARRNWQEITQLSKIKKSFGRFESREKEVGKTGASWLPVK